ncbi:MAG TPA: aminotransferase class IV [Candidatus Polarisedimenticolaceae bacterium]|nr:aminotransferase class IV [Candidatus Polarisedimenticolaceae bacterium]
MRLHVPQGTCWMDGRELPPEQAAIPVADPGLQSGLGVFETLAVRQGNLLDLGAHLERLDSMARALEIPLRPRSELAGVALERAARSGLDCGWLKIVATRGGHCVVFTGPMDPAEEGRPVSAVILPWRRSPRDPLAGLKTLNYAGNQLGLTWAQRHGADEGIWLNSRGHLAEACSANVFVVRHRRLFTPAAGDGILEGVVRGLAIRAARELGLAVHEGRIRLHRLERAHEAFLTSSLRGLRPLVRLGARPLGRAEPGPVTALLAAAVRELRGTA